MRFTLLQFFENWFCKNLLSVNVEDIHIKKGLNEVLNTSDLYKICELKKKQLKKMEKMEIEAPNLKDYLERSIDYDMLAIFNNLTEKKNLDNKLKKDSKNFREEKAKILKEINNLKEMKKFHNFKKDFVMYKKLISNLPQEENKIIGDISYNLGVIYTC